MNLLLSFSGLLLLHGVTGYGLLHLFNIKLAPLPKLALCMITGILIASCIPFILQLFYVPLTVNSIFITLIATALLLNIKTGIDLRKIPRINFRQLVPKIRLYELPALLLLAFMLFVSAWRCYYYPAFSRDGLSGPEPIAEYAIREHTLINSVFSVNLESTNNQFKSPFLTDLQVIYKMAGFPFGNVWLSLLVCSFFIFLYHSLSQKLHRVVAGLLLVFFLFTPEPYGYTFMCLYDYSNMILLFLGFYYLFAYFKSRRLTELYFAALMMAFSVYIRSETLVLVFMAAPLIPYAAYRSKEKVLRSLGHTAVFLLICGLAYYIPVEIYNNHYLPQTYKIDNLMNKDLTDLSPLFHRISYTTTKLLLGQRGLMLWGYFIYIFLGLFVIELLLKRKYTREAGNWLLAVLVIYLGLPLLGFLFPLMDLDNSTKRGLFKILPLMLLYMGNNQVLIWLSERIRRWENA